jgi:hypothetical protein
MAMSVKKFLSQYIREGHIFHKNPLWCMLRNREDCVPIKVIRPYDVSMFPVMSVYGDCWTTEGRYFSNDKTTEYDILSIFDDNGLVVAGEDKFNRLPDRVLDDMTGNNCLVFYNLRNKCPITVREKP